MLWCEKRDLNPYGEIHTPLKRARLPVPPLSHIILRTQRNVIYYTQISGFVNTFLKKIFIFLKYLMKRRRASVIRAVLCALFVILEYEIKSSVRCLVARCIHFLHRIYQIVAIYPLERELDLCKIRNSH